MGKPKPKPVVVPTAAESKDPESDESKSEQKIDDKDTEKKWIYEENYGWEQQNRLQRNWTRTKLWNQLFWFNLI